MSINHSSYGSVVLIELPTRLVMANAAATRKSLLELIEQGNRYLVFDLKKVEFIDSSGLSVLVTALKAAQTDSGEVLLLNPNDGVRSLIELTRLQQVFEIFEDREAAMQRFA